MSIMTPGRVQVRRATPRFAIRIGACLCTVLATLPYLILKATWLTGSELGIRDSEFLDDAVMTGFNIATAAMDAIAVLIAVLFVVPWGRAVPAWMIVLPAWIAAGLLVPIALAAPIGLLIDRSPIRGPELPLESWVFPLVYGGFTVQGISLAVGFAYYATERWAGTLADRTGASSVDPVWRQLVQLASFPAIAAGICTILWGWGVPGGLSEQMRADRNAPFILMETVRGLLTFIAVWGALTLARRRPAASSRWWATIAAGVGSGSMFGWGMWALAVILSEGPVASDGVRPPAGNLIHLVQALTGLVLGLASLFFTVTRSGTSDPALATTRLDVDRSVQESALFPPVHRKPTASAAQDAV